MATGVRALGVTGEVGRDETSKRQKRQTGKLVRTAKLDALSDSLRNMCKAPSRTLSAVVGSTPRSVVRSARKKRSDTINCGCPNGNPCNVPVGAGAGVGPRLSANGGQKLKKAWQSIVKNRSKGQQLSGTAPTRAGHQPPRRHPGTHGQRHPRALETGLRNRDETEQGLTKYTRDDRHLYTSRPQKDRGKAKQNHASLEELGQ